MPPKQAAPTYKKTRSQSAKSQTESDICDCYTKLLRMEAAHKEEMEEMFKAFINQMQEI